MRFIYEYQTEHGSMHNLGGSQPAQCWAHWYSDVNILGDMVVLDIGGTSKTIGGKRVEHTPSEQVLTLSPNTGIYHTCGINSTRFKSIAKCILICGLSQTLCRLSVWSLRCYAGERVRLHVAQHKRLLYKVLNNIQ